ncbi:MAG: four helix bundle protein [Bacteroidetes bacterium]|nr:four helix bundle protein [Bacteroidota bacterium]HET6245886.1 four helix bundle protein [Bacteroidia bacterium]
MKKDNIVKTKSLEFALLIIKVGQYLQIEKKEYILSKQAIRSGTSIGAIIQESEHAQSKADFIHKLSISLKEANETEYWIELLFKSGYIDINCYNELDISIKELLRLLISIIKSSKAGYVRATN